jgi:hypothetical protein
MNAEDLISATNQPVNDAVLRRLRAEVGDLRSAMDVDDLVSYTDQPIEDEVLRRLEKLRSLGEGSGHEFHGNQWTGGLGGFSGAPVDKGGAAKWRRSLQNRYENDKDFRAAADAVTLLTQSSTHDIRAASLAAAGHEKELTPHYQAKLDEPLSYAANPLAGYKNYFVGQDVENANYTTLREAGVALNKAIDTAPVTEAPVFRGMMVSKTMNMDVRDKIDTAVSGRVISPDAYPKGSTREIKDVPNPLYERISSLKAGDSFPIPGATSFTSDAFVAKEFSRGEARGQGGRSGGSDQRYVPAVVLEVRGARGLNAAALSPWKQKEVITRGDFKVVFVKKTEFGNYVKSNDYHIVLEPK